MDGIPNSRPFHVLAKCGDMYYKCLVHCAGVDNAVLVVKTWFTAEAQADVQIIGVMFWELLGNELQPSSVTSTPS